MHANLAASLDRADELLAELLAEYETCLRSQSVSTRAINLTHEVCAMLRNVLDRSARLYWQTHVAPSLNEQEKKSAAIYFPISKNAESFEGTLGRWQWKNVRQEHKALEDFLLSLQPFTSSKNAWLLVVSDLAVALKHIDLTPQIKSEQKRIEVSRGNATVSWDPSAVRFGHGVHVAGARVDPGTQRIAPTEGVTETIQTWVSFIIKGHNVNAAGFCKEACAETRRIVSELVKQFKL